MLKQLQKPKDSQGFTIIEVLIVLAIAGLIMVIVFLAVPNLQRSQRNNARKTDANNALSALSDFVSNNGGQLPSADCAGSACQFLTSFKAGSFDPANISYNAVGDTLPTTVDADHLILIGGGACANGAAGAPTAGQSRQIAAYYGIEGGVSTQCIAE